MNNTIGYYKSLVDPFSYAGVRLGWGCMVPTNTVQGYLRATYSANADGSFCIVGLPNCTNAINIGTGGAAVAAGSNPANVTDAAAIAAQFQSGRVVSYGVRAIPMIAATSVPGLCAVGAIEQVTYTQIQAMTPNDFVSYPTSNGSIGIAGASACGRPIDVNSFTFNPVITNGTGFAVGTVLPYSIPYISFTGLPASATIIVEYCLNLEVINTTLHGTVAIATQGDTNATVASEWPSIEKAWSSIKQVLPSPGRLGELSADIDAGLDNIGKFLGSAANLGSALAFGGRVAGVSFGFATRGAGRLVSSGSRLLLR